jgi:thiosulfate/3-mercaptopyruvate sulfurtransferase
VVYGDPTSAGWLFFALDYLGHDRISMLDGGVEKWRAEGGPVAVPSPSATTRGSFKPAVRTRLNATSAQVQAQLGGGQGALLDARSRKEYDSGRIPGARLVPWQDVYADPKAQLFKSREALVAMFKEAGAAPGMPAITYCQLGLRSSVLYFAAKYAGLDVSNYVGSWAEWGALGLPAER